MFSMSKISFLLQVMLVIPIILEIDYILTLWLGDGYPAYAASFACLILSVKTIGTLNSPISNVVSATGQIRKIKLFSAIVISSVVLFSILLFKLGLSPVFAYIALLVLTLINQSGCVIIMNQEFPYIAPSEYVKSVILPLLLHIVFVVSLSLSLYYLLPSSLFRLIFIVVASVFGSALSGYLIILNRVEKEMIIEYSKSFISKLWSKKK